MVSSRSAALTVGQKIICLSLSQAQLEENDGIVDMQCTHDDYAIHCTNLDLLLRSMATFFAW